MHLSKLYSISIYNIVTTINNLETIKSHAPGISK